MKAVRIHQPGGFEVLQYEDAPDPRPQSGQVLVRVEAIGVNFADTNDTARADVSKGPIGIGGEAAGTVVEVGLEVSQYRVGDRVAWSRTWDSYAELVAVPESGLVFPVPDNVTMQQAAGVLVQGMTAHYLACSVYPLKPGNSCLVQAAAGGVGLLLCQVAKLRGATVIGTVSTPEKARAAREAGADHTIIYTDVDFEDEVKRLTDGKGVNVVYDSVGEATFLKGFNCLAPRGMMVSFGRSSGPIDPFDSSVLRGSLYLARTSLASYTATKEEAQGRVDDLFRWLGEGKLKLRYQEFALRDAAKALAALRNRETIGKVILIP